MALAVLQTDTRSVEFAPLRKPEWHEILTPEAVNFVAKLGRVFEHRRRELLADRNCRQAEFDRGLLPDFLAYTRTVRESHWRVAPIPHDLLDRRVEITGPVERKTIINALNSGANVFMADFDDANSPTWANVLDGQTNLRDAVRRDLAWVGPEGKVYELNEKTATLMVRPRGWHLDEKHMIVDGNPISASIFDFGLFFFHNAHELVRRGTGPYFYLPKLESHVEAALWDDIFAFAQESLDLPRGTIRATVLIETITAAFEMDEILYELRDHSAGLNCGRWGYISSFIRKFRNRPQFLLPNRNQVTMDRHFLKSWVDLLIQTCHRRGIHAMGGSAAHIPIESDPVLNGQALDRVRQDKLREVRTGHDGTWVAHPALVPVAKEIFDQHMPAPNQIERIPTGISVRQTDLLQVPQGTITEQGLRWNIDVAIRYLESWLRGQGCVPIYNLMEDTATAEICRAQVWQWVKHGAKLDDGRPVTEELVRELIASQLKRIRLFTGVENFHKGLYRRASVILHDVMTSPELPEFLTTAAYNRLD